MTKKNVSMLAADNQIGISIENLKKFKTNNDEVLEEKLSNIKTQIENNTARVFTAVKDSFEKADADVIKEYFETNTDVTPRKGDVFLIDTVIEEVEYETSSYTFKEDWEAITGNVDADKVILREDFLGSGSWTQFGNYTKSQTGTVDIKGKGMSVQAWLKGAVSKEEQPKITANPAVSGFALTGAKAVEVGTKIETAQFGTAKLSAGSYTFGPATGIVAETFKVDRIAVPATFNKESVATAASGTDNNDGAGFIIGDGAEEGVVTSLKYKVTVGHNAGAVALTNWKQPSNPEVKIAAGTKTQETAAYTGYRSFFYGITPDKPEINSAFVRSLTNSNKPYSAQTITINVTAGTSRVAIACIAGKAGVKKVINETALNADVTGTFVKSTVSVEGANGYTAKDYNIWVFEPAAPFGQAATLKVTLG